MSDTHRSSQQSVGGETFGGSAGPDEHRAHVVDFSDMAQLLHSGFLISDNLHPLIVDLSTEPLTRCLQIYTQIMTRLIAHVFIIGRLFKRDFID